MSLLQTVRDQQLDRANRLVMDHAYAQLQRRPDPPRGVKMLLGVLTWEPPPDSQTDKLRFTHYNIYAGGDQERDLVATVPRTQFRFAGITNVSVFMTTYDNRLHLESSKVHIIGTI